MTTQTQTMTLNASFANYGHFDAIKKAEIKPKGIEFNFIECEPITTAFRRMCRNQEFDVCEMAILTYLTARDQGLPFIGLPIFPNRNFQHAGITYNVNAGINSPKDLEGKKAGVRAYTVTSGVWARGILHDEHGVDTNKIHWVLTEEEHVGEFHKNAPSNVEYKLGADLGAMHEAGELAGGIGIAGGRGRREGAEEGPPSNVKPFFPNAREVQAEWFQRTGLYPINHMVVIKTSLYEANPWIADAIYDAFKESKQKWIDSVGAEEANTIPAIGVKAERLPYGVTRNQKSIEAAIRYGHEQNVLSRKWELDELFPPSILKAD
jgi:4,5-dihydroxyphthalate decarboxylase